ncbi:hypothetical protein X924_07710 [Petrotoga sp. 9PWA.NaAc.5.4]|nr:hypothetical protein X924_07710 [Petrotoga sp. 9PWA.NaAc.5.4]
MNKLGALLNTALKAKDTPKITLKQVLKER